jgi:dipeptidyl-peptidase 4
MRESREKTPMVEDLPHQLARTSRFTVGAPDDFAVAADGRLVTYVRDGDVWAYDTGDRTERRIGAADSYHALRSKPLAVLVRESALWLADLDTGELERLAVPDAKDPRLDPSGTRLAYVRDRALRVVHIDGSNDRALLEPDGEDVTYGLAEFVARMEMGRDRGFWWAPDGERLLVARVDESPVQTFHLADPARPDSSPQRFRYPATGTANAVVTLRMVSLAGTTFDVPWDRDRFEYLVRVDWSGERPVLAVQSRDQRLVQLLDVDPATGETSLIREVSDSAWVTVADGVPSRTADGRLVWIERDIDTDT